MHIRMAAYDTHAQMHVFKKGIKLKVKYMSLFYQTALKVGFGNVSDFFPPLFPTNQSHGNKKTIKSHVCI